jgi:hypothetical protein
MSRLEEAHEALIESLAISSTIAVRSYKVLATSRLCANCALTSSPHLRYNVYWNWDEHRVAGGCTFTLV